MFLFEVFKIGFEFGTHGNSNDSNLIGPQRTYRKISAFENSEMVVIKAARRMA